MREQLLGYLLEALDPDERRQVEQALRRDPQLQQDLALLQNSLQPLAGVSLDYDPPAGLADRTCQYVSLQAATRAAAAPVTPSTYAEPMPQASSWSMADLAVAAGIFVAAGMLLFPAVQHSRATARRAVCQNNLRELNVAMQGYSMDHEGYFPPIDAEGNAAAAGVYSVELTDGGYWAHKDAPLCPSSELARRNQRVPVPTRELLEQAQGDKLREMQQTMGGSYGYNLGYVKGDRYHTPKNDGSPYLPVLADAPSQHLEGRKSANHGGCGQNVLYADGHVAFRKQCAHGDSGDNIFVNDRGLVAAGTSPLDVVLGESGAHWALPPIQPVRYLGR
ncbi:MAG: DUF1559 domain-containing protein [Pirellulales bacterium]